MADHVPPFLAALELDADADERAVRRAYAKRLKRIDPEADPAAFQALREVFEAALEWVARPPGQRLVRVIRMGDGAGVPSLRELVDRITPQAPAPAPASSSDTVPGIEIPARAAGAFSWSMDDAKGAKPAPSTPAPRPTPAPTPTPTPAATHESAPAAPREAAPVDASASASNPAPKRTRAPDADALPGPTNRAPATRPPRIATPAPASAPSGPRRLPSRPPALATVPQEDPAELVFAHFSDRFTRTASDEGDATRLLREALADARLVNLEARTSFEGRIAHLLAGGWRPGHEWLFQPACNAFEWETDRRRLDTFGPAGALLDAAVRERLMFFAQPAVVFEAQKSLIRRLRTERPTDARTLAPEMARLGMMMQRFPGWMGVMTRREIVQHWFDTWNALPEAQRAAARGLPPDAAPPAPAQASPRAPAGAAARPAPRAAARATQGTQATQAARTTRRPAPLPPVQPYADPPRRSFWGGVEGSGSTRWLVAALIAGLVRMVGGLDSRPHHAPAPPLPDVANVAVPAAPPPTAAQSIRELAGQGTQPEPDYPAANNDPVAMSPIDAARQQRRDEALARRQAQIDERYQEILRSRQAKQAIRPDTQGAGAAGGQ